MTYEITHDMEELRAMLVLRPCYVRMVNDSSPSRREFLIKDPERFIAVMAKGKNDTEAAFLIFPSDGSTAEIHFTFAPAAWGTTKFIARGFIRWVWENTTLNRLIGPVPSYNRLALQLATSVGFTQYDVQVGAGRKHGEEFNRILLECRRPARGASAHV